MKRSTQNQLSCSGVYPRASYECSSEDQDVTEPAEISKLLQTQKQQLEHFIEELGEKARVPVDLRCYTEQILNICDCSSVDDRKIIDLANNTIRKMRNNKRLKRNWNKEDLTILLWVMEHFNKRHNRRADEYTDSDWKYIASFVPGKNASQCMFKWLGLKKHNLSQYPWTEKEEALLKELVEYGKCYCRKRGRNKWIEISQQLYLSNQPAKIFRSPKQCREHWTCYMDPELKKGPWRPQEDLTLLKEFVKLGKRWSEIAKKLQGRTENAVKNRFNLLMMKQEKVQGRKRSHEHFSQMWIQILEREIKLNPNLMVDSDYVLSEDQLPETLRQRTNLPDELVNETNKIDVSADTFATDYQNKVVVRKDDVDEPEEASVRFVKFRTIPLHDLLHLTDLFPAEFNQHSMEITYRNQPCLFHEDSEDHDQEDRQHHGETTDLPVSYSEAL